MGFLQDTDFQRELNNIAQQILAELQKCGSGGTSKAGNGGFSPGTGRG